jgi:hypothetical protein
MTTKKEGKNMTSHYAQTLVGKTIKAVRELHPNEISDLGWYRSSTPTCVIEFTDDTYAVVMQDPEGNGTGFLDIGSY